MQQLTDKQQAWLEAYLGRANWNASEAARIAGYRSPSIQGPRLRKDPVIQAAISERLEAEALSAKEVLTRLGEQARAAHAPFVRTDAEGRGYVDLKGLEEAGLMRLVKKISIDQHGTQTIEFHDVQSALQMLGRHHRLFTDKTELTGESGGPIVVKKIGGVSTDDL